jgi:ABC-2 type transport system permease protein
MAVIQTPLAKPATTNTIRTADLNSALAVRTRPPRPNALAASTTLAWRALLKIKHVPMQLFDVTMFPIMMTLMFTFLFGGALAGSVDAYVQFLIPGILTMTIVMITMYTAIAINTDVAKGIFDRFRSLSFWRPAVLVGALLGDTVRYTLASAVVITLGVILGFRPDAGIPGVLMAVVLLLAFAFSLSWIWTALGMVMKTPEAVMGVSGIASFPLTFASNIFVNPETMPSWLQWLVNVNPVTHVVSTVRGLMFGTATMSDVGGVLAICAVLVAVFGSLSMYLYNNKNAR